MVELLSFLTIGEAQGKHLALFGSAIDITSATPVAGRAGLPAGGGAWLRVEARRFRRVWAGLMEVAQAGMTAPSLALTEVTKNFGPTQIIRGVSMNVAAGERHALIGPNGAGKTTLFNLISGRFPITSGEIRLDETRLDRLPPHRINRLGLSRSFQITSIFHRLSVFENIRCACSGAAAIAIRSGMRSGVSAR